MERTRGKAVDHQSKAGLAEQETENSKLVAKYCRGCDGRKNSQSHRRGPWKVRLEQSKQKALFPL